MSNGLGVKVVKTTPLLSICIQVFNRHETLLELLQDLPGNDLYEVVVYDFSTDHQVLAKNRNRLSAIEHVVYREHSNEGLDYGYDQLAKNCVGKYCWLLPDDDLVASENLSRIIEVLERNKPDFLLLNSDVWTSDYKTQLKTHMHHVDTHLCVLDLKNYSEIAQSLSYVGACIFKVAQWRKHSSSTFYNSYFMHVYIFGKILNHGGQALVTNLIGSHIRANNALWTRQAFIIWTQKWPSALHSIVCSSDELYSISNTFVHNDAKYIIYYYAYGALNETKSIQSMFTLPYRIFYFLLRLVPRIIVCYLALVAVILKNKKVVSEPAYYLLSSVKTPFSKWLLRRYF